MIPRGLGQMIREEVCSRLAVRRGCPPRQFRSTCESMPKRVALPSARPRLKTKPAFVLT
jgi:hypothetical protein